MTRLACIAGTALLCASCLFDPAVAVDGGPLPQIACDRDSECPAGWLCSSNLARCVPADQRDDQAPRLAGEPVLTPVVGGGGQSFTLAFSVSEPLGRIPVVELDLGAGRSAGWVMEESATDVAALRYGYRYIATGGEAEGSRLVTIDLIDQAGNAVDNLSAGSLTLDFTPPRVVSAAIGPALARAGTEVALHIELSEPLSAPPVVALVHAGGDSRTFAHVAASGTLGHDYAFTPSGSEAAGLYLAQATGADAAGNPLSEPQLAKLVLDFTPPVVTSTRVVPAVAAAGQRVLVEVDLGEDLASWGLLEAVATTSGAVSHLYPDAGSTGRRLRFEHTVAVGRDGHYQLELRELVDLAGNATALHVVGSVEYDSAPPAIADLAVDAEVFSAQAGHDLITATFDVDDTLAGGWLEVRLGEQLFACSDRQAGSPRYTCTYQVRGPGFESEGVADVVVRAVDGAGNSTASSIALRLDFTPPALIPDTLQLLLSPPPGCPIIEVTRWTSGSSARLLFVLDEPVGVTPTVRTMVPEVIDFDHRSGATTTFVFEKTLAREARQQGLHSLQAVVVDQVGNGAALALEPATSLVVDTVAPTLLVDQAAVRFVRSPWGNAGDEPPGNFAFPRGPYYALAPTEPLSSASALPATTFALDEGQPALLQVWADTERQSLLGATTANDDGSWPRLRLASLDTPVAFVSAVDAACNRSPAVKLEQAEWVASSLVPTSGVSPHQLWSLMQSSSMLRFDPVTARPPAPQLVEGADALAALAGSEPLWRDRTAAGQPGERRAHAMAYDSQRGVVVMFGGLLWAGGTLDTWEWDGQAWTEVTPVWGNPAERYAHAMAYDSQRGVVVMFGGYINGRPQQDTWEWDGQRWAERTPALGSPPARANHALAFDSARGRVVLFGGDVNFATAQDTWEWDGESWRERTAAGSNPPAAGRASLTYDSARGRSVLYFSTSGGPQTWEWDGEQWQEMTPASGNPTITGYHALAFDHVRSRSVLVTSEMQASELIAATWEWDGQGWSEASPTSGHPPGRYDARLVYDGARGRCLLYGGADLEGQRDDTWEWDGLGWRERTPARALPPPRAASAMAYDTARQRIVQFGGSASSAQQDTWEWDGSSWSEVTPLTGNPPARTGHAMASAGPRGRVLLFGGDVSAAVSHDTWLWDGSSWSDVTPDLGNPQPRTRHALAYDGSRWQVVLFGGATESGTRLQDTWVWDGSSWSEVTPVTGNPPARTGHAMVFDEQRGFVVMFGGDGDSGSLQDTWEWDGQDWVERRPTLSPAARTNHAMAYDSVRRRTVLYGGYPPPQARQDTWEWDGEIWTEARPASGNPPPRSGHTMAFDAARGRSLVFGGGTLSGLAAGTFDYGSTGAQPAIQFKVAAAGAGFAAPTGLRVRAHCGGMAASTSPGDFGAALLGWSAGGPGLPAGSWNWLVSNGTAASATAPHLPKPPGALLDWSAASADEARAFLLASDRSYNFQCRSLGMAGPAEALVALDYIEVRVRYRP